MCDHVVNKIEEIQVQTLLESFICVSIGFCDKNTKKQNNNMKHSTIC